MPYRRMRCWIFVALFAAFAALNCSSSDNSSGSTGGSTGSSGATADTTPPVVSSTTPTDTSTNIAITTTISVTFGEAMQVASISAPTTTTCGTATLQVSSNNFTSCIAMTSATPTASGSNTVFTMTPAASLANGTTYKIRVTTSAKDAAGNALASQYTSGTGFATVAGGDVTPPTVSSTTPANAATGIAANATISVTFSEAMTTATLTAPTTTTCGTATLQVSLDNFANCIAMSSATPAASGGNTVFTMTPATNFASATTYKIRVTTSAQDASANALAATYTTATGFTSSFAHTITIDGTNDFTANETFATSTGGYTTYISWDATYVYVGYTGADVSSGASNSDKRWVITYIGAGSGTNTGITYNTQTPGMPTGFNAKYQMRFKGDGSYTNTQIYTSSWGDAAWDFTGNVFRTGTYVEFRIPRTNIASPSTLKIAVNMLIELNLSESSYGVSPSTSFTDGYNPSYAKFLSCNLSSSSVPTTACTILP